MFKPKRDSRFGSKSGGKKFGERPPWKRDDRGGSAGSRDRRSSGGGSGYERRTPGDMGKPMAHDATCADCGKLCKVPFKPNGKKPVYCINCFKKEGNAPEKTGYREASTDHGAGARVLETQLKAINAKLDAIMEALNS
jgi:CxxC-x17-CxxC domain-containing protein